MTEKTSASSNRRALLRQIALPLLAIITALLVSSIPIAMTGTSPVEAYSALGEGAFGSKVANVETLIKATPFILVGLGIALAFRGGLFYIGVEGQLFAPRVIPKTHPKKKSGA